MACHGPLNRNPRPQVPLEIRPITSNLELELIQDIRRSVLCGELHLSRDIVADGLDAGSLVLGAWAGPRPVGTARLTQRQGQWALETLAVLAPWRLQGIGRELVQALAEAARAKGADALWAVAPQPAAPFLGQAGFEAWQGAQEAEAGLWRKPLF